MVNFFIGEIYKIDKMGAIPVGVVAGKDPNPGTIKKGMKTVINNKILEIVYLESHHEQLEESLVKTPVGIGFMIRDKKKRNEVGKKTDAEVEEEYNLLKDYVNKQIVFN